MSVSIIVSEQAKVGKYSQEVDVISRDKINKLSIKVVLNDRDLKDPTKIVDCDLQYSSDGIKWIYIAGFTWDGNSKQKDNTKLKQPSLIISPCDRIYNNKLKVTVNSKEITTYSIEVISSD
jgi:hypothetical protein